MQAVPERSFSSRVMVCDWERPAEPCLTPPDLDKSPLEGLGLSLPPRRGLSEKTMTINREQGGDGKSHMSARGGVPGERVLRETLGEAGVSRALALEPP